MDVRPRTIRCGISAVCSTTSTIRCESAKGIPISRTRNGGCPRSRSWRYRRERMSSRGAFMGQLSVDIGNFYAPAPPRRGGRFAFSAWNSTATEIAREVWHQVRQGLEKDRAGVLADPDYVHLDEGLEFSHPSRRRRSDGPRSSPWGRTGCSTRTPGGQYTVWVNGEHFTRFKEGRAPVERECRGRLNATTAVEQTYAQVRPRPSRAPTSRTPSG